jgi:hypothetical protein
MPSEPWTKVFREPHDGSAHRDALEPELLRKFAARTPAPAPRRPWLRLALAGLLAAGVGVGACQIPTEYERPLGQRIGIILPADKMPQVDPEAVAHFVEENYPIEGMTVRVEVRQDGDGAGDMRIAMEVVGPDIDIEEVWDDLLEHYPVLDGGRVEGEVLEGIVHGTWGGRLGLQLDEGSIEDSREQLLQDLRDRGIEGNARITIEDEETTGGRQRRIEVRVEAED